MKKGKPQTSKVKNTGRKQKRRETGKLLKFFEKRWWQGLSVISAIVLACVFGIPPLIKSCQTSDNPLKIEKPITTDNMVYSTTILESITPKSTNTNTLVDSNYIWKLSIDNSVIDELYNKAHDLAVNELHDATLTAFYIIVYPYWQNPALVVIFDFYSQWTDRSLSFSSSNMNDVVQNGDQKQNTLNTYTTIFDELPWIQNPEWQLFLRKSYEKVSISLQKNENTHYQITASAGLNPHWVSVFVDGSTEQIYRFSWDGQGDPISLE
jgi:hypothetical protein